MNYYASHEVNLNATVPASLQSAPSERYEMGEVLDTLPRALGNLSVEKSNQYALSDEQVVLQWETNGFVREAPRFIDQAQDVARQNIVRYESPAKKGRIFSGVMTESEGLQELHGLLTNFLHSPHTGAKNEREKRRARDMLENLTFIGQQEYQEAARGIGNVWKAYLDADPRRQLCILTEVGSLDMYRGMRKSDAYLKNEILEGFSDEELAHYSGRIVERVEDMNGNTEHGTIILLEDWVISGEQMSKTYEHLSTISPEFRKFADRGRLEVQVIVASDDRIQNGLSLQNTAGKDTVLPLRAYYKAHRAATVPKLGNSLISGSHSSVNYGFGAMCDQLVNTAQRLKGRPRLSHITRPYRYQPPTIEIAPNRLRRLPQNEIQRNEVIGMAGPLAVASLHMEAFND